MSQHWHAYKHTHLCTFLHEKRKKSVAGKKSTVEIQPLKSRKSDENRKSPLDNKHG